MEVLLLTVLQLELHTAELSKIEPDIRLFHSDLQYPCGKAFPPQIHPHQVLLIQLNLQHYQNRKTFSAEF